MAFFAPWMIYTGVGLIAGALLSGDQGSEQISHRYDNDGDMFTKNFINKTKGG